MYLCDRMALQAFNNGMALYFSNLFLKTFGIVKYLS